MRDLEFIPSWYTSLLRRRRLLLIGSWLTLALAATPCLWLFMADRNVRAAEIALDSLRGTLTQTQSQLEQMERLEQLLKQWRQQDEALRRMGIHIEAARMLEKLAEAMPPTVSMLSLNFEVEEVPLALSGGSRAALAAGTTVAPALDRRLRIRMQGVAPTDVELANLLMDLNKVPFFDQLRPTYARDRREAGHILREFELTFQVNLNTPHGD